MKKEKRKTAGELLARLSADPNFVARQRQRDAVRLKQEAEDLKAEEPIRKALKAVGVDVLSVWDLVNRAAPYPDAVPVLVDQLEQPHDEKIREGLARALAVPESIRYWHRLVRLFESHADTATTGLKWALGCALAEAADDSVVEDVVRLIQDRKQGESRIALISALERLDDPRAQTALLAAQSDPELSAEAKAASRRLARKQSGKRAASLRKVTATLSVPLAEASMNFDAEKVESFLRGLARILDGFGSAEIRRVTDLLANLRVDEEGELSFQVRHGTRTVPLLIRAVMDDVDAPDLYFFSTRELAWEIEQLMERFAE